MSQMWCLGVVFGSYDIYGLFSWPFYDDTVTLGLYVSCRSESSNNSLVCYLTLLSFNDLFCWVVMWTLLSISWPQYSLWGGGGIFHIPLQKKRFISFKKSEKNFCKKISCNGWLCSWYKSSYRFYIIYMYIFYHIGSYFALLYLIIFMVFEVWFWLWFKGPFDWKFKLSRFFYQNFQWLPWKFDF